MTNAQPHRLRRRVLTRTERGSGTLLTMTVAALILAGAFAAVLWITVLTAKHQAAVAADLGSLSAANTLQTTDPTESACETAARIANEHGATLTQCAIDQGTEVVVAASVELHLGNLGSPTITATSRAGPIAPGYPPGPDIPDG